MLTQKRRGEGPSNKREKKKDPAPPVYRQKRTRLKIEGLEAVLSATSCSIGAEEEDRRQNRPKEGKGNCGFEEKKTP